MNRRILDDSQFNDLIAEIDANIAQTYLPSEDWRALAQRHWDMAIAARASLGRGETISIGYIAAARAIFTDWGQAALRWRGL